MLKAQSEQIAQLQKDLEQANQTQSSMQAEILQLKGGASSPTTPVRGRRTSSSPTGVSPTDRALSRSPETTEDTDTSSGKQKGKAASEK